MIQLNIFNLKFKSKLDIKKLNLFFNIYINMSDIKELNKKIDALTALIQSDLINKMKIEEMINNIETKLDLYINFDTQVKSMTTQVKTFPSRPTWFKDQFALNNNVFINDGLYTSDDINELFKNKEVVKKKKDSEKIMKIGALLYAVIKDDKTKFATYCELHTNAKNEATTINNDEDDEETKSDN